MRHGRHATGAFGNIRRRGSDEGHARARSHTHEPALGSPHGHAFAYSDVVAAVWAAVQGDIGFAQANAYGGLIAEENFERSKISWREPADYAQALVPCPD